MTAGTDGGQGGIGAAADYLEIDVDAVAGRLGVLTAVDTAATSTAGVFLDELGDLPVNIVDTDGDVSLVASGSIVDGRNGGLGDTATGIAGNSIDLVADDGSIGAAGGGNDVEIDSSRGAVGDVGLVAPGSILVTETAGVLNLVIASAGGNIRLTVRDNVSRLDDDLVLLRTGSVRLGEGTILAVPNGRIAAPFGSVTLRVGDDITTDRTSEILAGAQIDIFGDDTDTDPSVGSTVVLRGTITPGPGFLIRVLGNADPDTILFDQTVLAGKTRAFGGNGEDTFTVFQLPTMNVGAGDTLTLDGQAQGDRYTVQTTGSQGDRRTYVINVLDTGAPDDGADTLSIFGNDAPASSDTAPADDIFLLRRATSIPGESADRPAYVALLHGALALHRDRPGQRANRGAAGQLRCRPQRPAERVRPRRQRLLRGGRQQRGDHTGRWQRRRPVPDRPALRPAPGHRRGPSPAAGRLPRAGGHHARLAEPRHHRPAPGAR